MSARALLTPRAEQEIAEAVGWIAADSPSAARALRDAIMVLAQRIADHPQIGVSRSELAPDPYRFVVVRGFPYLVVYNAARRPPVITRVVHGARDLPELLKDL